MLVYLDQNTLSDLRRRKLEASKSPELVEVRRILIDQVWEARCAYSFTHLDEIRQIRNEKYVAEHIELLGELNAVFLDPATGALTQKSSPQAWRDYLENERDNERLGITATVNAHEAVSKKFAGLEKGSDFSALDGALRDTLTEMLENCGSSLTELASDGSANAIEIAKSYELIRELKMKILEMPRLPVLSNEQLGPQPFRNLDTVRALRIETMQPRDVIPALDTLFRRVGGTFRWEDHFDNTVSNQIARCFTLMNWAGYCADDFTSSKKGKDRFRASSNDMLHAQHAAACHCLISRDQAFLKKAEACYAHIGVETKVKTPEEFTRGV